MCPLGPAPYGSASSFPRGNVKAQLKIAEALSALVDARVQSVPMSLATTAALENAALRTFPGMLKEARTPEERAAVGLYWAKRLVSQGPVSNKALSDAMFRFAHHLRLSMTRAPR